MCIGILNHKKDMFNKDSAFALIITYGNGRRITVL